MPPTKRTRPAFSPPRPGKTTSKTTAASDTTASKKRSRASTTSTTKSKSKPKPAARKRKRTPSPHNSSSAPSSPASSAHDNDEEDEDDDASRDTTPASASADADTDPYASADGMLVEITNEDAPQPSIPLGLIHRIMLEHWDEDEDEDGNGNGTEKTKTTKLSGDAREVLGAYVDTFVREAVARAAFEAGEREQKRKDKGSEAAAGAKGWLDVEDLERVGGGLVLDF